MVSPELTHFMAAKYRVAELEDPQPPNFSLWTTAKLRKEFRVRQTILLGRRNRTDLIRSLESQMKRMRGEYQNIKHQELEAAFRKTKKSLYSRPHLMLASTVKEIPDRLSFLDLPGEIRNMIYDLALFESPPGDHPEAEIWKICFTLHLTGNPKSYQLYPVRSKNYLNCLSLGELWQDRTISAMRMLAAINKQIRQEVQTLFWSRVKISLAQQEHREYFGEITQLFRKIGPGSVGAVTYLNMPVGHCYFQPGSQGGFFSFLSSLAQCKNLKDLKLCLPTDTLFGQLDHGALMAYFIRGEVLNSPNLNNFANVLRSLPRLKSLQLRMSVENPL